MGLQERNFFSLRAWVVIVIAALCVITGTAFFFSRGDRGIAAVNPNIESPTTSEAGKFYPSPAQWATLTIQPIEQQVFRSEFVTEGKIAIDEDRATRIFSPYAGRVTKLLVVPGNAVERGQSVFVVEAADSVDTQKDFVAALGELNKARSQLNLATIVERRIGALHKDKAMALKDWEEAQANLTAAQNDLRSAEIALQAVRNRLRLLGKTDAEIDVFEKTGIISPDAPIHSPLQGTVLQRRVGPGQYVNAGASDSDPVFLIGDTSRVWLVAYVRESDAAKVRLGRPLKFTVLSHPDRVFDAKISYIAPSIDPSNRRLLVRASIDNSDGLFKPEMFANVSIVATEDLYATPAVPGEAVIYDGDGARVWVALDNSALVARKVKLGLRNGRLIQVLEGLAPGDKVVTRGGIFVDRASGS